MHYTETQELEIQRAFASRRRRQWALAGACSPIILFLVAFKRGVMSTFFWLSPQVGLAIALVVVIGAWVFSLRNWRCPGCNRYLGRAINPGHCPHCMVHLR